MKQVSIILDQRKEFEFAKKLALIVFMVGNAFFTPLLFLFALRTYADSAGIVLVNGCQGPEMFFGLFSGIIMALQLKYIQI